MKKKNKQVHLFLGIWISILLFMLLTYLIINFIIGDFHLDNFEILAVIFVGSFLTPFIYMTVILANGDF